MASKKKKKNRKRRGQNGSSQTAWPTLLTQGAQTLERGAVRDAIGLFKQALKKGAPAEAAAPLLFRAYLAREEQLKQKGMLREADAVHRMAVKYQPSAQRMTADDLLALAPGMDAENLLTSYLNFLDNNPPATGVEHHIAGAMIISRQWPLLSCLDAGLPLRRDAACAELAAGDMYAGRWETALERLKVLPRTSPYAPAAFFCRAMSAFYAEDDGILARAVSMIPVEFTLYPLARRLLESPESIASLWEGSWDASHRIRAFSDSLENAKQRQVAQKLKHAAEALLPETPRHARRHLLELLYPLRRQGRLSESQWQRLVRTNLDRERAHALFGKFLFYDFASPLLNMVAYFEQLEKEFPAADEVLMARSVLILETLKRMETEPTDFWMPHDHIRIVAKAFGLQAHDLHELKIGLNVAALELDPDNREGYERLASWNPTSRISKNLVERGFLLMCDHFPDDPFPCLELASLYYGKNAFRKAEAVLVKALQRAPHDRRVLERRILSFLISAHQSLKRGKLHLARRDLDLAMVQDSPNLRFIIAEKQALFQLEQQGQLSLFEAKTEITPQKVRAVVSKALAPLSLFDRLKTLGFLALDCDQRHDKWPEAVIRQVHTLLARELRRHSALTSDQIIALLKRPPREFEPLTGNSCLARFYVKKAKKLLSGVAHIDIFTAFDILVEANCPDEILTEIKRRKPKTKGEVRCLLAFYETTVRHLKTSGGVDLEAFQSIVDSAKEAWVESLRAAARRLSPHADMPLQHHLATFDFSAYMMPCDDLPPDLPDFPFFDDDDDDDFENRTSGLMALLEAAELLETVPPGTIDTSGTVYQAGIRDNMEAFIRENDFRGLPEEGLLILRREMARMDSHMLQLLLSLKKHLTRESIEALSSEAWAFFVQKD